MLNYGDKRDYRKIDLFYVGTEVIGGYYYEQITVA